MLFFCHTNMYMFVWMYNLLWNDGKRHGLTPLSVLQRDVRYADNPVEITECERCVCRCVNTPA